MEAYFATFPGVRKYMDDVVAQAKERGYVETLFHRRRELPEIRSSNFNMRSFGERVALNMPIQGTAADIMKLAMVAVEKRLKRELPPYEKGIRFFALSNGFGKNSHLL